MNDLSEKQLSSSQVFDGVLLKVYKDEVELPNGSRSVREYIKHPGAAVMVPVLDNGNIVMERQYRYPVGTEMWELPAGKIDAGEDPLESAKRELELWFPNLDLEEVSKYKKLDAMFVFGKEDE